MKVKSTAEIEEALAPVAASLGVEIYEVVFKQGKNPSLTVFLDTEKEGGIDLDTCEKFHNAITEPIDELDPSYGDPYTLNVSSPGLDRPFKTTRDFERNLGKEVEVKLYSPLKGKKLIEGILSEFDENSVTLAVKGESVKLPRNRIAKINKAIKFE